MAASQQLGDTSFRSGPSTSRPWEETGLDQGDPSTDDKEEAGVQLARCLVQLHAEGRLSAKSACILSHWAHRAGAAGPVADLAFRPDAPTGHFQRHLDRAAGFRDQDYYRLSVPTYSKKSKGRVAVPVSVVPPHEAIHAEFCEDPRLLSKAESKMPEWPTAFGNHPVSQKADGPVTPLALYLDGAQYSKVGASVLVIVVVNMLTGTKHLISTLNKRLLCRCGCRGWCTLRPLMEFLAWSLGALATGAFPSTSCDGAPWSGEEKKRASLGGLPLACGSCAVQQVRGDWAEFAHSLGFPTWRSNNFPCLWCSADRDSLYQFGQQDGEPADQDYWALSDHASYTAACDRCEVWVTISTIEAQQEVAGKFFYDKRTYGNRGRCLKEGVATLGLLPGDRLEPSAQVPDVGLFEELQLPITACFWRTSKETAAKHRNPLFGGTAGLSVQSLKVDTLHCLALGVWQSACVAILQAMADEDLYGAKAAGCTTVESRAQHTLIHVQADLSSWQSQQRRKGLKFTAITTDLGLAAAFRLKGGETKTLLSYLTEVLQGGMGQELKQKDDMLKALLALDASDVATQGPFKWEPRAQEDSDTQTNGATLKTETFGFPAKAKHSCF